VFVTAASAAAPAFAAASASSWPQYQGNAARTGFAAEAPALPYRTAWSAPAGIGDTTHISGIPAPILTGSLAIVVGREDVTAVDLMSGAAAWMAPRAIGPSSPAAVAGDLLLFLEGGGDESASASSTPSASSTSGSASPSTSANPSASSSSPRASVAPTSASATTSTLVAIDLATQERAWTLALSEVSHTGVLLTGETAIVGTDDGQVTAVDAATGKRRWSVDAGDHVIAPMAATAELVLASVRPETQGTPSLLALRLGDGSEAWRYQPTGTVFDLGGPSVAGDLVYFVASDDSVRAASLADGSQQWASLLYTPTAGSPPAVNGEGVFVTDQSGTIYRFDPATGAESWRFATNRLAIGGPVATPDAVLQPTSDGTILGIDATTGHQVWHASVADAAVIGLAVSDQVVVATHTGTVPGFVGLQTDPSAVTEDIASPTTPDPGRLLLAWFAAALPIVAALVLSGRALGARMGTPDLGAADDEDLVDPWETDTEDPL
jgi:outer membrane protein assembly factor BamB